MKTSLQQSNQQFEKVKGYRDNETYQMKGERGRKAQRLSRVIIDDGRFSRKHVAKKSQ